jgi:hypothetical protein
MLIDIFNQDNSITINYKAITLFGLSTAAYLTLLISIYRKATRKNKLDNDFFKLDRSYIQELLGMSVEEQLVCDGNLLKLSIIRKSPDDPNKIKVDLKLYLSLLNDEDLKLIDEVRKSMKVTRPKGLKQSQRQIQINNLKNCIQCSNYELLTALRDWVDGVYANPKGFLSKASIKVFQDTLNNYTKGDLDLALRIVQIATVQGYRDCNWAINLYEKESKPRQVVRVTEQEVASKDNLSDTIF